MTLRVASFNANSIRMRLPIILDWLKKEKPDVLGIQELKAADEFFPLEAFEDAGYHAAFKGQKAYNGVALLTKKPLKKVQAGFDDGSEESRIITGELDGVVVVNTYIPQGNAVKSEKFQYKLGWFKKLYKYFDKNYTNRKRIIWMGDVNVARHDIDVHSPDRLRGSVGFHPDEHKVLEKIVDWGFEDIYRKHNPKGGEYTFYDYRVKDCIKRGLGWRIDYIWATKSLAKKSKKSWIDMKPRHLVKPSDHTFLVADFVD